MSDRRAPLAALPFWPRYLSREEAARYVGVSPEVFDVEVDSAAWPPARRRGSKGGRLTWDRLLLDAAADRDSGLGDAQEATPPQAPTGIWKERSLGKTPEKRAERR